jgi:uncharacterized protein
MASGVRLSVYVQPRASRTEIAGWHGTDLKIRLASAPVDNAANAELIAFIAQQLGIPKRSIQILTGFASRRKVLEIEGAGADALAALHSSAVPASSARPRTAIHGATKHALRGTR